MTDSNPRSWFDRAISGCMSILVAAIALYFAVALIEAVWPYLVAAVAVASIVVVATQIIRARRENRW
jgi:TctA family transporter